MMTIAKTSVAAIAVLASTLSLATAAPQSSSQVTALQQAERRVDRAAGGTKGGAQQRLLLERQKLRSLIDDLDAGKAVDPAEVDRALRRAENPGL
jgi:hypothetical protein